MTEHDVTERDEGPVESITQPPDSSPPSVWLSMPSTQVVTGVPASITLHVDRGTNWILQGGRWAPIPAANFQELVVAVQGLGETRDHRDSVNSGGTYPFTFLSPGSYQVTGTGNTTDGRTYTANPMTATAVAPPPPSFTWNTPADGTAVGVGPNGGSLTVDLTTPSGLAYPLTVQVGLDGTTTSDQDTGTHFTKSRTLAQTPLGPRPITVTVVDAQGRSTSQSRSVVAQDSAPPAVSINPFTNPLVVSQLPAVLSLSGTTSGAASGIASVGYSVPALNISGQATNTGPNGDWSTWTASIPFSTTGDGIAFSITATDVRGGTGSATSQITIQF
ncbi:hypothetical protein [Actinomadura rupiterrae]|uniref:hypothetical protein n=1 Tax=Actinomadura rupiterrae TaxID=559627 RepID=UPI0020A5C984|nr:hypothetical protein [Actinomadura rupiterrae]MCP2341345.1 hypothetical protein [Actinomadura rupiterrae]